MNIAKVGILIFSSALLSHAADEFPAAKKEDLNPDGVWKPIAAVLGGARLPKPALDAITLKISGDQYEVTVEGEKEPDKGTIVLDESTSPKRMLIKSTDGPNRGKTIFAIYEMKDGRSLRVCYDLSGTEYPKEFKAPKGTQLYLAGYRRVNEETSEKPKEQ